MHHVNNPQELNGRRHSNVQPVRSYERNTGKHMTSVSNLKNLCRTFNRTLTTKIEPEKNLIRIDYSYFIVIPCSNANANRITKDKKSKEITVAF